jgi:hypothetical protein
VQASRLSDLLFCLVCSEYLYNTRREEWLLSEVCDVNWLQKLFNEKIEQIDTKKNNPKLLTL